MRELMDTKDKMLIMGHKIGDTDSFGAAIGIWRIATSFNKKARIVINGVNSSVKPMMARFENSSDYPEDLFLVRDFRWLSAMTSRLPGGSVLNRRGSGGVGGFQHDVSCG